MATSSNFGNELKDTKHFTKKFQKIVANEKYLKNIDEINTEIFKLIMNYSLEKSKNGNPSISDIQAESLVSLGRELKKYKENGNIIINKINTETKKIIPSKDLIIQNKNTEVQTPQENLEIQSNRSRPIYLKQKIEKTEIEDPEILIEKKPKKYKKRNKEIEEELDPLEIEFKEIKKNVNDRLRIGGDAPKFESLHTNMYNFILKLKEDYPTYQEEVSKIIDNIEGFKGIGKMVPFKFSLQDSKNGIMKNLSSLIEKIIEEKSLNSNQEITQ